MTIIMNNIADLTKIIGGDSGCLISSQMDYILYRKTKVQLAVLCSTGPEEPPEIERTPINMIIMDQLKEKAKTKSKNS